MRICIVGAGVSGIQTAFILSKAGHECCIFEKNSDVGGVWKCNYDGYALQVPSELYEIVGYSNIEKDGTFPDGQSVFKYIKTVFEEKKLTV